MLDLSKFPKPEIIEELDYFQIKEEQVKGIQKNIPEYKPLESDNWMPLVGSFSYRELFLRARINEAIKALLLPFSEGSDLDALGVTYYGVERLKGEEPFARFKFSLSAALDVDITLPAGTELTDGDNNFAYLKEDVVFKAGEIEKEGIVFLRQKVKESSVKTETIITPLPFVVEPEQLENFTGGSCPETDEEYRERLLLSFERFSTAGSEGSYIYHTLSADERIDDVSVFCPACSLQTEEQRREYLGKVQVFISSESGVDDLMIERVKNALNAEKVRPLTDFVEVFPVTVIEVTVSATIELFDLLREAEVDLAIKENFEQKFKIGEDLTKSDIIRRLHVQNVYRVTLHSPENDVLPSKKEVLKIVQLQLQYKKAQL